MALENYATRNPDEIQTDVLSKAREACYKARDAFYTCLQKESDKKPTEIATVGLLYPVECKQSRAEFVKQCRPSWVKHFDRQYCQNKRVQRLLDDQGSRRGPLSLPQPGVKIELAPVQYESDHRGLGWLNVSYIVIEDKLKRLPPSEETPALSDHPS